MSRRRETATVQHFTDMAGIERLAAALFHAQAVRAEDPLLREVLDLFVADEVRHAHAAQLLADYYDVNHYRVYQTNRALRRFTPRFVEAIHLIPPHVATAYITCGELLLDMVLLRSINDFVSDEMSQQVIDRINRDESRHVAVDYYMAEYYASDTYHEALRERPRRTWRERTRTAWTYVCVGYLARPFIRDVFFRPMDELDRTGQRMREAFKHVQLFGAKPGIRRHADAKYLMGVQRLHNLPLVRPLMGPLLAGLIGMRSSYLQQLYSDDEATEAEAMSFDDLAQAALAVKYEAPTMERRLH
jgi:hypothetical protein